MSVERFHMTPDGPKPCVASKKLCRFDEHYDNQIEAEQAYEKSFGGSVSLRKYAPPKPDFVEPTLDEVLKILQRVKRFSPDSVVGYSLAGSNVYGLQTPDSDRDLFAFTDNKFRHDFHKVYSDGNDIRVASLDSFIGRVIQGQPVEVDLIHSPYMHLVKKQFEPFLRSIHIDMTSYIDKNEGLANRFILKNIPKEHPSEKKTAKTLKTAFRCYVMSLRAQNEGRIRVLFSDDERERFYQFNTELKRSLLNGMESEDLNRLAWKLARKI